MTNVDINSNYRTAVGVAVAVPAVAAFVYWLSWKSYRFVPIQVCGSEPAAQQPGLETFTPSRGELMVRVDDLIAHCRAVSVCAWHIYRLAF
jgi:hypothetical protein